MVKRSCFKYYIMIRKLLLLFLVAIIPTLIFAQAPGNNCGVATPLALVPGGTISTGLQTTLGLGNTYTAGIYNSCVNTWYGNGEDGTYSITIPPGAGGNYNFTFISTGTDWKSLSIHSGCGPISSNCVGGFATDLNLNGSTTVNLTPGTYYIIIDSYDLLITYADFELEITAPIANDDPCSATPLSVNIPCSFSTYTTEGASASAGVPAPGCANYVGGDVWFSVTVPASGNLIIDSDTGVMTDSGMAIYSGTCGVLTLIECDDDDSANGLMSSITRTGLTPGATIYIRVWEYGNDNPGTFDICVTEPPPPPTNDDSCNAIALGVNIPCSFTTYTNESATASSGVPAPGCAGYTGGDVWFSTIVPASGTIVVDTDTGVVTDSGMALYSGACGSLVLIECDDDDSNNGFMSSITLTGRTPGEIIYIRVWELGNNNNGTFDICVSEPPPPPPNDNPCTAVALTPGQGCVGTFGYVEQATDSGINAAACGGTPNDDVWYSFVATNTTHTISLTNVNGSTTDMYHAVYGGFTSPDCSVAIGDNISCSDANISTITGLTVNDTYFVQVYTYFGTTGATSTFDICIKEPCQLPIAITTPSCPFIDVTPDTSTIGSCGAASASETLTADFLDLGDTSDYDVNLINYNATTFANLAAAATSPVALSADDRWSDASYVMPIDFCFYGTTVNNFVVGANGIISFDTSLANTGSGFVIDEDLPSTDASLVENAIYAAYHDIDPGVTGSGPITFGATSIGGCNVMVVLWDNIPMFDNGNFGDNSLRHTAMAVLYEDTNIIEVLIEEKVIDDVDAFGVWNDGNAIVGLQNIGATQAVVAPCRNSLDDNWATTNEAWRFTPSGGASIANLQWLVNGTLNATYDGQTSITVSPSASTTYTAQVTYTLCNSTTLVISDATTVNIGGGKVWDGSEANDNWMDPLNWSDDAIPTAADCVIIPNTGNDPVIYDNDNGDGLFMIIETGATLTLTSDTDANSFASSLTIQDFIDIQGTGVLTVEDNASLIQVYDSTTPTAPSAANSGNIVLNRDTNIRRSDYVYWSSPVDNFNVSNVYGAFTPLSYIYQWTPTVPTGNNTPGVLPTGGIPICYGNWALNSSATMNLGKGYIVRGPTNHTAGISTATAVFTGVPNNGVITQPISSGTNSFGNSNYTYNPYGVDDILVTPFDDNWNLLGNPYPSALDAQTFLSLPSNSIIEGAVHIWTHGTQIGNNGDSFYDDFSLTYDVADYITYNFSGTNTYQDENFQGKIGSGQGFFVLALADSETGNVTFNNSMRDRTHSNTAFYRTSNSTENVSDTNTIERNRIWLNLVNQNGTTSSILVGYIEGATQEKDRLFDAYIREVNSLSMYSKIGDQRMIIQGRALPFDDNDQVPLGTVIPQPGEYTIAISNVDGLFLDENQTIYLEDTYTGVIHNLRTAPYSFTESEAVDYEDRFILRYTNETLSANELELGTGLTIIAPESDYIKVNSERSLINSVTVYDLLGRVLFNKNAINKSEFVLNNHNFSAGTYIVKATLANGQSKAQKIVLKD